MSSWTDAQFETDPPEAPAHHRRAVELLDKARLGDRAAFGQLVLLFQDRLYNALLRFVGDFDEARELTQETFTRALLKIDTFRGEAQPYTWLFRIGMNLAISQLRKEKRRRTFSLDQAPGAERNSHAGGDQASALLDRLTDSASVDPASVAIGRERSDAVVAALGRLDPEYRAVLVMRDIEDFDYQQMADVLELPLGTLKSRLFRARLALREELKDVI